MSDRVPAVHRYPLRVQWEDTDAAGIVYYANYLRFIERGRSDLLLAHGISQRDLMDGAGGAGDRSAAFAVRACAIEYLKPARLHDELIVTTALDELRGASLRLQQAVWRGEERLAEAAVRLACIDSAGRPRRVPAPVAAIFATLSPNLSR
ncbi:YbgC/FadM family acyl-CoA thioesterase [Ferrovibrio sp.]|uniref:YbgC/FadM family acyl-CoA thioesterase n=1 Tax=Ferrovibrio sp. TaxID=1917215 RepID=UPI0035186234